MERGGFEPGAREKKGKETLTAKMPVQVCQCSYCVPCVRVEDNSRSERRPVGYSPYGIPVGPYRWGTGPRLPVWPPLTITTDVYSTRSYMQVGYDHCVPTRSSITPSVVQTTPPALVKIHKDNGRGRLSAQNPDATDVTGTAHTGIRQETDKRDETKSPAEKSALVLYKNATQRHEGITRRPQFSHIINAQQHSSISQTSSETIAIQADIKERLRNKKSHSTRSAVGEQLGDIQVPVGPYNNTLPVSQYWYNSAITFRKNGLAVQRHEDNTFLRPDDGTPLFNKHKGHEDSLGMFALNGLYRMNQRLAHSNKDDVKRNKNSTVTQPNEDALKLADSQKDSTTVPLTTTGKAPLTSNKLAAVTQSVTQCSGTRPVATCTCSFCGKSFGNTRALELHVRRHSGLRPYACKFCSKAFYQPSERAVHMRTHTGARPYRCPHCLKLFRYSGDLKQHINIHTGQRPYQCEVCSKAFTNHSTLRQHRRIHTGERPYKCETCDRTYRYHSSLKQHLTAHANKYKLNGAKATSPCTKPTLQPGDGQ